MGNYPGSTTLPAPTGEVHLSETVHMAANTFTCTPSPTSTNTFTCGGESVDAAKTKVSISQVSKTTVRLTYAIQGVGIADGRYGVHIHTGTTCASAAAAGGHMWAPSSAPDPWALSSSTYTMVNNVAVGSFDLDMGYSLMSVEGRVVVIHASNGDKIACSPLVKETAIALEYDMNHLGANSAGGIHIHAGTECVSAGATVPAGHYYDTAVYVKSVFIVHVGGIRGVPSSTDHIMNIHSRVTLPVEFIRTCIFICLCYVSIQGRV